MKFFSFFFNLMYSCSNAAQIVAADDRDLPSILQVPLSRPWWMLSWMTASSLWSSSSSKALSWTSFWVSRDLKNCITQWVRWTYVAFIFFYSYCKSRCFPTYRSWSYEPWGMHIKLSTMLHPHTPFPALMGSGMTRPFALTLILYMWEGKTYQTLHPNSPSPKGRGTIKYCGHSLPFLIVWVVFSIDKKILTYEHCKVE